LLGQKLRDSIDEPFGGVDRRAGAVERYVRFRPQPIIGDRLDIIGLGQGFAQLTTLVLAAQVVKIWHLVP
jgi:hypothetical protein